MDRGAAATPAVAMREKNDRKVLVAGYRRIRADNDSERPDPDGRDGRVRGIGDQNVERCGVGHLEPHNTGLERSPVSEGRSRPGRQHDEQGEHAIPHGHPATSLHS